MPDDFRDFVIGINPKGECKFRESATKWTRHKGIPFYGGAFDIEPERVATKNEIKGFQAILSKNLPKLELSL